VLALQQRYTCKANDTKDQNIRSSVEQMCLKSYYFETFLYAGFVCKRT